MKINAVIDGDHPEVTTELVAAQAVQPWMVLYDVTEDDELLVVAGDPEPFRKDGPTGRPERWVSIPILDGEPVLATATERFDVVLGAPDEGLQPLFDPDLYTAVEEALARNGLCHEQLDPAEGDENAEPVWCGRPSDPASVYRDCTEHDQQRQLESETVVSHGFAPTYGAIAEIA